MPRRSAKASTIGAEDRLRDEIRDYLAANERGSTWFANQMQKRGCHAFTAMTLTKVLGYGRAIYVDEGIAMADIVGLDLNGMTR